MPSADDARDADDAAATTNGPKRPLTHRTLVDSAPMQVRQSTASAVLAAQAMTRGLRLTLVLGAVALAAIGLGLLSLLTQATNDQTLFEQNYGRLWVVNGVIAACLLLVIAWIAVRLIVRLRKGKFGSRLLIKLALIFALVGFLPGVLIYVVSYQFVSRSIENWFDLKVERALDAGLMLGRASLDNLSQDAANKTRAWLPVVLDASELSLAPALERVREQLGATDVIVWSANAQPLAAVGASRYKLNPDRPTSAQLRAARTQKAVIQLDGLDDVQTSWAANDTNATAAAQPRVKVLVHLPAAGYGLATESRFLQATMPLPAQLAANAVAVQEANREYQERALARVGLKRMYIGTLTLSLFLAVFSAILLAVLLGNQLVRPLLVLADGVRQVAEGDLTPKAALLTKDELGGLTRSFADMTQQLLDARSQVQQSLLQLGEAGERLQTILDNQTSAVMVLDNSGRIIMANPGATRVLRAPIAAHVGDRLDAVPGIAVFGRMVLDRFARFDAERALHEQDHWQDALALTAQGKSATAHDQGALHFMARGAPLGANEHLLVIDDISEIVSAERATAWGEVARRLAHEIKNPLTPIQLSAERLARRLDGKLQAQDAALLTKSVGTIVDQVDAMKRLVNEFRDYARLPAAQLQPLDINALVTDVLQLYPSFQDAQSGFGALPASVAAVVTGAAAHASLGHIPVYSLLDEQCPTIQADAQQLRQVLHNLVQNAQDACEPVCLIDGRQRAVTVRTRWVEATRSVRLSVQDDGPGFPDLLLKRAFEPYITTKAKGTGLGLAVVKKIADEHGARIELSNRMKDGAVVGAQISLSFIVAN